MLPQDNAADQVWAWFNGQLPHITLTHQASRNESKCPSPAWVGFENGQAWPGGLGWAGFIVDQALSCPVPWLLLLDPVTADVEFIEIKSYVLA